ncbi:MarR family winged helix-turn-helix transcriptional regulator [Thermomonospora amylolytica]|uniref:MarR family winged helix-turn-helix transcriptional regulator n=1 Tax=Thermomonospora amylolytica TaxID=1411117 RepID=UPI000E6D1F89|nr:MarR family transcriptional regulator [Thermomonospora amylolytica]
MSAPRHDGPPADDLERLAAAVDEAAGVLATVWSAGHLTAPVPATQLRALFVVERHGSLSVSALAEEMGALLSSASRLCGRLEATGLLERVPGADRRVITVRLSAQGRALLEELRQARRHSLARILAGMDPADRTALLSGLRGFRAATVRDDGDSAGFSMPA